MRTPLEIGSKIFKFKKDALTHYKTILNSYKFGDSINEKDFNDIIDLLNYDYLHYKNAQKSESELDFSDPTEEVLIEDIKVVEFQYETKCFKIYYSNSESNYISYIEIINRPTFNPRRLFTIVCRDTIQKDLRSVKQSYFDINSIKGLVPCQETGIKSAWKELVVDHRQPNTFSIIIDRFIELNQIDFENVEYVVDSKNILTFEDKDLLEKFKKYHKEKATLRIVRKERNSSRSNMAKISLQKKDLRIE